MNLRIMNLRLRTTPRFWQRIMLALAFVLLGGTLLYLLFASSLLPQGNPYGDILSYTSEESDIPLGAFWFCAGVLFLGLGIFLLWRQSQLIWRVMTGVLCRARLVSKSIVQHHDEEGGRWESASLTLEYASPQGRSFQASLSQVDRKIWNRLEPGCEWEILLHRDDPRQYLFIDEAPVVPRDCLPDNPTIGEHVKIGVRPL